MYIKSNLNHTEIWYDVEITLTVLSYPVANTLVAGIYRSKTGRILQLIEALTHLHKSVLTEPTIAILSFGDLNINLMQETTEQKALKSFLNRNREYTRNPVPSFHDHFVPSHFVPSFGHFVPPNSHFVPKNSHFVPSIN